MATKGIEYTAKDHMIDIGYFTVRMVIIIALSQLFVYSLGGAMTGALMESLPTLCEKINGDF